MQTNLKISDREFILVGTAHVSQASIEEVEKSIEENKPDCVAIELDENRLKNIKDPDSWKKMDIIKVLKNKQGFLMLANIVLAGYQKRMGKGAGIKPGDEMVAGMNKADKMKIPQEMVDRPIAVTLRRAWAKNSFWGKCKLLSMLIASAFSKEEVSVTEIENLKQTSEMDTMMSELSTYLPVVKEVLIDERDFYLASKIWSAKGNKVLAVLGAGHLPGVQKHLEQFASGAENADVSGIETVPPKSFLSKILTWTIPAIIMGLIITGFIIGGVEKGTTLLGSWVIWNGALAGLGAIIGGAHILTILVSIVMAPLTSLCPFVGIGLFSGLVQAVVKKPSVEDMENLQDDATSLKGFYRNRILRVLVIFFLSSLGSMIGTFVGGASFIGIFAK
ncbi:MAG: TraB/GumN family protein [Treponema sp.]|nr:TraB/GumN family protein [Treponema sp.]